MNRVSLDKRHKLKSQMKTRDTVETATQTHKKQKDNNNKQKTEHRKLSVYENK